MTGPATRPSHGPLLRGAALAVGIGAVLAGTAVGAAQAVPQGGGRVVPMAAPVTFHRWAWAPGNVNIHQYAGSNSKVVVVLGKGRALGVITTNTSKGWVKVSYKGRPGYVMTTYVKIAPSGTNPLKKASTSASGAIGACKASYYGYGSRTASGERFNRNAMTAAHKTYTFGTKLKVTNKANHKSVVVRINDRGPYVSGRCLDLTTGAFSKIASTSAGVAAVTYQVVH